MDKISVIIPMYNTESFIRQCLQSVIDQTYRNLEIIVIDDGSTDCSLEVCRNLSLADDRIQLFYQENGGASKARNYGLDIATGEYVFFLDSDDAIHPLLLGEMMRQAKAQEAEMVFCDCTKVESTEFERVIRRVSTEDMMPEWQTAEGDAVEEWFHTKYGAELSGIWGLIHMEYIGILRFDESLVYGEDTFFKYHLFCRQGRTVYSPVKWYYYRMHPMSITHSRDGVENIYLNFNIMLRDSEYKRGHYELAVTKETEIIFWLNAIYTLYRERKNRDECKRIKEIAEKEKISPLFKSVSFNIRLRHICCFRCYPVYVFLDKMIVKVWELQERFRNKK